MAPSWSSSSSSASSSFPAPNSNIQPPPTSHFFGWGRHQHPFWSKLISGKLFGKNCIDPPVVGKLWQGISCSFADDDNNDDAHQAWKNGDLCSIIKDTSTSSTNSNDNNNNNENHNNNNNTIKVVFRNQTPLPLLLCWVSEQGQLHHFYRIDPWKPQTSSSDNDDDNKSNKININNDNDNNAQYHHAVETTFMMTKQDHLEYTEAGHAFCWITALSEEEEDGNDNKDNNRYGHILETIRTTKSLGKYGRIVGGFRPSFVVVPPSQQQQQPKIPLVTITTSHYNNNNSNQNGFVIECGGDSGGGDRENLCCGIVPPTTFLRHRNKDRSNSTTTGRTTKRVTRRQCYYWHVQAEWCDFDMTPINTVMTKQYKSQIIGGWPCMVEPNWSNGDVELEQRLALDLQHVSNVLPIHAKRYLMEHCKIWINTNIAWGPKACPVQGIALCYHPERQWLIDNGLHEQKYGCIEIQCARFYKTDCVLWGPGGLLLHELSHAYHHSMIPHGYDNEEIEECYQQAMKEGLYNNIEHHTLSPDGKKRSDKNRTAKTAYASTNCMEYWAELSTAFLGGGHKKEEYNKWFPFNRHQLQEHDPRAFQLLSKLWHPPVDDDDATAATDGKTKKGC